ncbi:MIP/aquaporin family protein [Olivibacter domesticus]|uniref:Aquaporin Z n=1 Tax=Olivibacter domesticus TaxID=407022 RepID=A0A1H7T777_OLID1|nr:aquaporin [Olivibacter domesticus]SEL80375.1 aquaporin Z [Olivibacter domesticus]
MKKSLNIKKYVAEFIGTFMLVFCGTGAIIINQQTHGLITHVGIAITFGLVVMGVIYAFGNLSGAHINPAVSIAFAVNGCFSKKLIIPYISSQLAGAFAASLVLKFLFPADEMLGATVPSGSSLQSFTMEFLLTFFLMIVIMRVAKGNKEQGMFAGLAIGAVVALEAMFAGPISGASMNPARSLAPAVISGHYEHIWVYVIATISGALVAVPVVSFMKTGVVEKEEEIPRIKRAM